jgi:hypothetical protein
MSMKLESKHLDILTLTLNNNRFFQKRQLIPPTEQRNHGFNVGVT